MTRAEPVAACILLTGGIVGVSLLVAGVLGAAIQSAARPPDAAPPVTASLHEIARGLSRRPIDPVAVSGLAIVILFATPLGAVAGAGLAFVRAGDVRFAVISALVVAAVGLSFWLGGL